ncbi:proline-rich acidic protein 1 isoform X2 [Manis pentadactyla]|uniref:proline-rich acidic protein 1 isoform X2 n=1 Tax=Manis pentadactyla TaxID=143292 RepID=UPI00255C8722|nr:proline-rich acidic protein 1 isoform X2 [Manis pentadactyla]
MRLVLPTFTLTLWRPLACVCAKSAPGESCAQALSSSVSCHQGPGERADLELQDHRAPSTPRRGPNMKRLLLVTSLAAMLLQEVGSASLHQVFVKTKGKVGPPAQDTEEAWGALAAEPPDGGWLRGQLTAPGLVAATWETRQGATAWPGTEDALGRVPSPRQGPEPDPDDRYHPWPEEAQDEAQPWSWVLPSRQELQGPEEDRDYIYHPRGTSWGP